MGQPRRTLEKDIKVPFHLLEDLEGSGGHGIDEKTLITTLDNWNLEGLKEFRKNSTFFDKKESLKPFEQWKKQSLEFVEVEFMRFKDAMLLWMTHPWKRDARLIRKALKQGGMEGIRVLIEVACTRTRFDLFGVKDAYYVLYKTSIVQDIYTFIHGSERELVLGLMTTHRHDGSLEEEDREEKEKIILESKKLVRAFKDPTNSHLEDKDILKILTVSSKCHLEALYKHCNRIGAEPLNSRLQEALLYLANPVQAFTRLLETAIEVGAAQNKKDILSRVIVTRTDIDMKEIKVEFEHRVGFSLTEKVRASCNGNYKDFLLVLLAR